MASKGANTDGTESTTIADAVAAEIRAAGGEAVSNICLLLQSVADTGWSQQR
ncbi:MAG: hypothetical protein P8L31_09845 [Pseudomonadales bacterium]|nr:hypothetical protein [Pseudomonadales bacterium]